jgi:hypothetical protein
LVAFTITMTRIGPPLWVGADLAACSTHTAFGGTGNRHYLTLKELFGPQEVQRHGQPASHAAGKLRHLSE